MTRDEALEKLKSPGYDTETIDSDFEYIATKIGITKEELNTYLTQPNKTYKDYKSQENIYSIGAKVMRILGLEKGGKR
jgi:hypothetical protein